MLNSKTKGQAAKRGHTSITLSRQPNSNSNSNSNSSSSSSSSRGYCYCTPPRSYARSPVVPAAAAAAVAAR
ncbi:hypothetical protein Emag_004337 [Eimeria magna]